MKKTIILTLLLVCFFLPAFTQVSDLALGVMEELEVDLNEFNENLIVEKIIPYSKKESIIVIPEIAEQEEDFMLFNSHVVIVNNKSGEIISRYYESHETNGWESDAIRMNTISIDTAPYKLAKNKRAFGVRIFFEGSSRVNPFSYEMLSLFIPNEDKIDIVLNNLTTKKYHGEWNGDCEGEFTDEESILIMDTEKTNGYYDIIVAYNILITQNTAVSDDDCVETIQPKKVGSYIYKFVDGIYQNLE